MIQLSTQHNTITQVSHKGQSRSVNLNQLIFCLTKVNQMMIQKIKLIIKIKVVMLKSTKN